MKNFVGYDRFETDDDLKHLQLVYKYLHDDSNFIQTVMKLIKKKHIDGKTIKVYDIATSPFRLIVTY